MIMKSCMFVLQSRGYGKTYYEKIRKKEQEDKNKKVEKLEEEIKK